MASILAKRIELAVLQRQAEVGDSLVVWNLPIEFKVRLLQLSGSA